MFSSCSDDRSFFCFSQQTWFLFRRQHANLNFGNESEFFGIGVSSYAKSGGAI